MINYLSALAFLFLVSYCPPSAALPQATKPHDDAISHDDDIWDHPIRKISIAKTNYDEHRVVITATLINRQKPNEDFLYGGSFSPTAAAYLKPFKSSRIKTFVQASCLDYFCESIVVSFGVKTTLGNPYAYEEPKFILSRID